MTSQATSAAAAETIVLGMGCFWGAERRMAELAGVFDVESGYANGEIHGDYPGVLAHEKALASGRTKLRNHAEVVKVRFDPARVGLEQVLARFWESHDPTQLNRQGNDIGTNYRSAIYTSSDQQAATARKSRDVYQAALKVAGRGTIVTEIEPLKTYFRAEEYHQDYLKKNPGGYCGLGGAGVKYPGSDEDQARLWEALGSRLLTPEQHRIAFESGTEPPWTGPHLDEKRSGTFVDPLSGAPLFRSDTKYDSRSGWPSFFDPLPGALTEHVDVSHGMRRVEVRSASSGIHLGHVFDDGPPPTGKRYCVNGNVLRFVPDAGTSSKR